jgi:hypothetical protein
LVISRPAPDPIPLLQVLPRAVATHRTPFSRVIRAGPSTVFRFDKAGIKIPQNCTIASLHVEMSPGALTGLLNFSRATARRIWNFRSLFVII